MIHTTRQSPKFIHLVRKLRPLLAGAGLIVDAESVATAVLERLWHATTTGAIRGDIGRYDNEVIAEMCGWLGDADLLIGILLATGWLDADDQYRLIVHDWHDHAPKHVKGNVVKVGGFVTAALTGHDTGMALTAESSATTAQPSAPKAPPYASTAQPCGATAPPYPSTAQPCGATAPPYPSTAQPCAAGWSESSETLENVGISSISRPETPASFTPSSSTPPSQLPTFPETPPYRDAQPSETKAPPLRLGLNGPAPEARPLGRGAPNLTQPNLTKLEREGQTAAPTSHLPAPSLPPPTSSTPSSPQRASPRARPSLEEVLDFAQSRQSPVDPHKFHDHYTANGWVQSSGRPIDDWRAAFRVWERREEQFGSVGQRGGGQPYKPPSQRTRDPVHDYEMQRAALIRRSRSEDWDESKLRSALERLRQVCQPAKAALAAELARTG